VAALAPLRFDLAALVNRRYMVMNHYRPVNTYVARTLAEFAGLRHAGGESS
jgi:hypothetical protein